jgi:hypothetical protein
MRLLCLHPVCSAPRPNQHLLVRMMAAVLVSMLPALTNPAAQGQSSAAAPPSVLASASAGTNAAQSDATTPGAAVPAANAPESAEGKSASGAHDGIVVHGYWKIDIRNPDGSLARHVEFENSLVSAPGTGWGPGVLDSLLLGNSVSLGYAIWVRGLGTGSANFKEITFTSPKAPSPGAADKPWAPVLESYGPCGTYKRAGTDCILASAGNPLYANCNWIAQNVDSVSPSVLQNYTSDACVSGLSLENAAEVKSETANGITLKGTITAGEPARIAELATLFTTCPIESLTTCQFGAKSIHSPVFDAQPPLLTSYVIPEQAKGEGAGIPIQQGQSATITVKLSFTSAAQ